MHFLEAGLRACTTDLLSLASLRPSCQSFQCVSLKEITLCTSPDIAAMASTMFHLCGVIFGGNTTYYDQSLAGAVAIPPNKLLEVFGGVLKVVVLVTPYSVTILCPANFSRLENVAAFKI